MYHQLSKFTGRVIAASNLQSPLFPIAPVALQRVESPAIQYTAAKLSTVSESDACSAPQKRRLVPGTNIPFPPVPESIRKQQEKFLKEDDVPVFLKGGPMDAILYRLTMALCVVGLIGIADVIYSMAFPKKP